MDKSKIQQDIDEQINKLQSKLDFAKGEITGIENQLSYLKAVHSCIGQGDYDK